MESTPVIGNKLRTSPFTIFMAIVATLFVFLSIVDHWKTFNVPTKFVAVALMANLVVGPLFAGRLGRFLKAQNAPDVVVRSAYM